MKTTITTTIATLATIFLTVATASNTPIGVALGYRPSATLTTSLPDMPALQPHTSNVILDSQQRVSNISPPATSTSANSKIDLAKTATLVHQKINDARVANGLKSLSWDPALAKIAANHSIDMAKRNYFAHNDLEGRRYTYRYSVAGYVCERSSGENIYWYGSSKPISESSLASKVVNAWMHSPGHRHNILNTNFHLEGIGVAFDSNNGSYKNSYYVTEDFCSQRG